MYKLIFTLVTLILVGVGLSLSLPKLTPSGQQQGFPSVNIDQKSESSPILIRDFYLTSPLPEDAKFTLQLGMYPQLPQAQSFAKTLPAGNHYRIVKTTDNQRFWYLVLQGSYPSQEQAALAQQDLKANQISSNLKLLPKQLKEK